MDSAGGRIVLAATPLGNPGDASPRLRAALAEADVIAAEDTRRLRRLIRDLDVHPTGRITSFYDAVERERAVELADAAEAGEVVLVVSDAGMPTVSDPGYRLVALAAERGLVVTALPGPSAVVTALAVSGLPVDRFTFEGFLPRKAGERSTRLAELSAEHRTMVFFEAPHRLAAMLRSLVDVFGPSRRAAGCRELTKTYEEVRRGTLAELVEWADGDLRGEVTVVVAGIEAGTAEPGLADPATWPEAVAQARAAGMNRKEAMVHVARRAGVRRSDVYEAVVRAKVGSPHERG